MNALNLLIPPIYYLEIGHDFLKAEGPAGGLELRFERQSSGRLTPASKEKVTLSLQSFLKRKPWQPRSRVVCAISARGVTLRRLSLPASTKENLQKLLLLQIESEFPLSPEELAWGYRPVHELVQQPDPLSPFPPPNGAQDLLVVAVKKEVVEEYTEIVSACGASPVFTLAALARSRVCPQMSGDYTMLDIGPNQSELMSFTNGVPTAVRVLSWGSETVTRAIEADLGVSREEAERLSSTREPNLDAAGREKLDRALAAAIEPLSATLNGSITKLYLTGVCVRPLELAPRLANQSRKRLECEPLEAMEARSPSAAIAGLKRAGENGTVPLLLLQAKATNGYSRMPRAIAWESAKPALALVIALLCLPYAEALLLKPFLSHRLNTFKANKGRLLAIDRELGFLQYLKQNQAPYLDALYLISKVAPPGAHIDSMSMNRNGELSLRISMREPNQAVDFRSKLIDSGFFSSVAVEEQAPSPDRQKLSVRLSAQWKPASAREALAFGPTPEEIEKAKSVKNRPMVGPPMMPFQGPVGPPVGSPGVGNVPPERNSAKGAPGQEPRKRVTRPGEIKVPPEAGSGGGPQ
jgi:Tfp pilus assembly PilM family ATPase